MIGIKFKKGFRIAGLLNQKINPSREVIIQVQSRPLVGVVIHTVLGMILFMGLGLEFTAAESILEMLGRRTQYSKV